MPGLPLIRAVDTSLGSPAIDLPLTVGDQVAGPDAGALRAGESLKTPGHQQPALALHDRHADARELAAVDCSNSLFSLAA